MWNLKNKTNEHTKKEQIHKHKNKLQVIEWGGFEGMGEKGEREEKVQIASYLNSHGDIKYSLCNIANNIVITMYGVRWVLDLSGWSLHKLYKCLITILYS